jgi:hypothetical protein
MLGALSIRTRPAFPSATQCALHGMIGERGFRQNEFRQNLDFVSNWILAEWNLAEWILTEWISAEWI